MENLPVELEILKEAAMPLIKYLNENHAPHSIALVGPTSVEIFSGEASIQKIYDHVKD